MVLTPSSLVSERPMLSAKLPKASSQSDSSWNSLNNITSIGSFSSINWSSVEEFKLAEGDRYSRGSVKTVPQYSDLMSRVTQHGIATCSSTEDLQGQSLHLAPAPSRSKVRKKKKQKATVDRSTSTSPIQATDKKSNCSNSHEDGTRNKTLDSCKCRRYKQLSRTSTPGLLPPQ